jgi:hypothetical protein
MHRHFLTLTIIILLVVAYAVTGMAQPPTYYCLKTTGNITIDGKLDDFAWTNARRVGHFTATTKPSDVETIHTEAALLWDDTHLYVAISCFDTDIWTTKTMRDSNLHQNENVEVFLAPDGVGHPYIELQFNARNVPYDAIAGSDDPKHGKVWNMPGMRTMVQVYGSIGDDRADKGWTLEVAIPWKEMAELGSRFAVAPSLGDSWRMNLYRIERPGGWEAYKPAQPVYNRLNDIQPPPGPEERQQLLDSLVEMKIPYIGLMWAPIVGPFFPHPYHNISQYGNLVFVDQYPVDTK